MDSDKKEQRQLLILMQARLREQDPRFVRYADKYLARTLAARLGCPVPELYCTVTDGFAIPFDDLPDTYVVKPTHLGASDGVLLMHRGRNLADGRAYSRSDIAHYMNRLLYRRWWPDEWAMGAVEPRIMVEEKVPTEGGLRAAINFDCRCYVFDGRVEIIGYGRSHRLYKRLHTLQTRARYYGRDWRVLELVPEQIRSPIIRQRPVYLEQMVGYAERLAAGLDFVCVDFYLTPHGPVFGEFSLYPGRGHFPFTLEADRHLAAHWRAARHAQAGRTVTP
jgi:hypothetical protein